MKLLYATLAVLALAHLTFAEHIYNLVVLGAPGVGKSSLLNMLANEANAFEESHSMFSPDRSFTPVAKVYPLVESNDIVTVRLVDTRGDAADNRTYSASLDAFVRELNYTDAFVLCVDASNPRFTASMRDLVEHFNASFPNFMQHTVLVFTKWSGLETSHINNIRKEYRDTFAKFYGTKNMPAFFLDSRFKNAAESVKKLTLTELVNFKYFLLIKGKPYATDTPRRVAAPKTTTSPAHVTDRSESSDDADDASEKNSEEEEEDKGHKEKLAHLNRQEGAIFTKELRSLYWSVNNGRFKHINSTLRNPLNRKLMLDALRHLQSVEQLHVYGDERTDDRFDALIEMHDIAGLYFAVHTTGDGNCLYNAVSRLLFGTERLCPLVRLSSLFVLVEHEAFFRDVMKRWYYDSSFENLVEETSGSYKWGNMLNIASLAIAINRGVYLLALNRDTLMPYSQQYSLTYYDENNRRPLVLAHTGSHFVPLLAASERTSLPADISSNLFAEFNKINATLV